jgi:glutathione synthase/RimK-type ligase-like ATP-grasp enzyme
LGTGRRIALVTCRNLPEPDPDQELLLSALRRAGVSAEMLAWDDPEADPGAYDLCVLRSCWNYYEDPDAFLGWVRETSARSRLANPVEIVRWNLDKRYLQDLERAGVQVIPTVRLRKGEPADLAAILRSRGWDDVVVKPAVSAASFRTRRFRAGQSSEGQSFLERLVRERDAMVQRHTPGFEDPGERALVWIDGELTHAVRKSPRFEGGAEQVSEALPLSREERALAEKAIARVEGELLYARVDVVADADGTLLVSELELMEPSLFLLQNPPALERFVRAIARRAG